MRASRRLIIMSALASGAVPASAPVLAGQASQAPAGACSVARIQAMAPADTTITAAAPTVAPVPHCKVEGYVTTDNPGPNRNHFRLQLPDNGFENRYYFIGMGGSAGYVPTDSQIPAGNPMHRGFAVAGTDTGRQGNMLDWAFLKDPAKALDHSHRSGHVVAVATQKITREYYRTDKIYRYHSGCSGGGRMGVQAAENHPEDYDGILIGAPGGRSSMVMMKFLHATREMMREPGAWLSPAKLAFADAKVTAACDALDGAKDGIVSDHRACKVDFKKLQCAPGKDGAECLTQPEVKSIEAILHGPRGADGKLLSEPFPISNMSLWSGFLGAVPPPWNVDTSMANMMKTASGYVIAHTVAQGYFGDNYDILKQFDFKDPKQIASWFAAAKRTGFGYPYSADLRGVQKSGGKILLWGGVSDPCCSDVEFEQYYNDAARITAGGPRRIEDFMSFYRVPGIGHCGGGTGPADAPDRLLVALIDWVERGKKPQAIVAHRGAKRAQMLFANPQSKTVSGVLVPPSQGMARDFLLCPYPKVAVFNGSKAPNAVDDAKNWSCGTRRT
jgi:feruloyl esterase